MRFSFLLSAFAVLALSGCSWLGFEEEPPPPPPVNEEKLAEANAFPYELMAPEAPPPMRYQEHGDPPGNIADEYGWRSGHWEYKDGPGFTWKRGYWIRKPAFSAVWKNDVWLERAYGWTLVPGHWE